MVISSCPKVQISEVPLSWVSASLKRRPASIKVVLRWLMSVNPFSMEAICTGGFEYYLSTVCPDIEVSVNTESKGSTIHTIRKTRVLIANRISRLSNLTRTHVFCNYFIHGQTEWVTYAEWGRTSIPRNQITQPPPPLINGKLMKIKTWSGSHSFRTHKGTWQY